MFAALLDPASGGRFALSPAEPFEAERAYVENTNVLETTFQTASGAVRVTDAMTIPEAAPLPWNELLRRIEGVAGTVAMQWVVEPRFEWGHASARARRRGDVAIFECGDKALTVHGWDAGMQDVDEEGVRGRFEVRGGERALIGLGGFSREPFLLSERAAVDRRFDETLDYWRRRAAIVPYDGPWRDAVVRSALALLLLVHGPTGAIVAAPTTSLPERIGGDRNYDYRFAWLRDTSFTLEAMLRLGYADQVHASLGWLLGASVRTHPRLSVFYQLDGGPPVSESELDLAGYKNSSPVVMGNDAGGQLQLGNYSDMLQAAWLYVDDGNALDSGNARRLAEVADFVCEVWQNPDASIWELDDLEDYTQGKLAVSLALDRAVRLAEAGEIPGEGVRRWRQTGAQARRFVEERCWSDERGSYLRGYGADGLDASILLGARGTAAFFSADDPRLHATIDALQRELGRGPLMYRFSGMADQEGAFLACSFWLVEALVFVGRADEAADLMANLVARANDVGLYSEEMDPESGEMLGNFPQALTHLALVNAAYALAETDG